MLCIDLHTYVRERTGLNLSNTVCADDPADVNKDKFKLVWMELSHPELRANGVEFQHLFEGDPNYTQAINTLSKKPFPHEIK